METAPNRIPTACSTTAHQGEASSTLELPTTYEATPSRPVIVPANIRRPFRLTLYLKVNSGPETHGVRCGDVVSESSAALGPIRAAAFDRSLMISPV